MASLSCGRFAVELDAVADVTTSSFCTFCDTSLQISMAQSTQGTTCWIFHEKTLTGRICFFAWPVDNHASCRRPFGQKQYQTFNADGHISWKQSFFRWSQVPPANMQAKRFASCSQTNLRQKKSNLELPQDEQNSTRVPTRKTIHSSVRHQHKITEASHPFLFGVTHSVGPDKDMEWIFKHVPNYF